MLAWWPDWTAILFHVIHLPCSCLGTGYIPVPSTMDINLTACCFMTAHCFICFLWKIKNMLPCKKSMKLQIKLIVWFQKQIFLGSKAVRFSSNSSNFTPKPSDIWQRKKQQRYTDSPGLDSWQFQSECQRKYFFAFEVSNWLNLRRMQMGFWQLFSG